MSLKTLIFLLLTGASIYGLVRLFWPGERSNAFETELGIVDTAALDRIVLGSHEGVFSLKRASDNWIVSRGAMHLSAVPSAVTALLGALSGPIRTRGLVTQKEEEWSIYGVDEVQGLRVQLYQSGALSEDFILGAGPGAGTFLRFRGQRNTYEIAGFPLDIIGRDYAVYRNPVLLELPSGVRITGIEWQFPDTLFYCSKSQTGWICNNTLVVDSVRVAEYLKGLQLVSSRTFADDFDEVEAGRFAFSTLTLTASEPESSYFVECFRDTLSKPVYYFRSDRQPEVFFAEDSTGLFRRLFKKPTDLITETSRK